MWRPNRKTTILFACCGLLVVAGLVTAFVLYKQDEARKNTPEAKATRLFQALSKEVSLPLYTTKNITKYPLQSARAEDGAIVISTYDSDKGVINVTQQPKPATDPFGTVKPVASFISDAGEGRLFPDDKSDPYIVISSIRTWIIVRSTSESIRSDDLKEFCITLQQVKSLDDI